MSDTQTTTAPTRRTDELLSMLVERLGGKLAASTVYGTPVERDGVTVVPVAAARFGVGAGSGSDPGKRQEGEGGGGGGMVTPVGYIELKGGGSRFVPVVHPGRMAALVLVAALGVAAILRFAPPSQRPSVLPWR
jgi:uncharacterized spore protein YtfJ